MAEKQQPLGICDHCLSHIPPELGPYTCHGRPRLYCSRDCRNTGNSRTSAQLRREQMLRLVAAGEWQNPIHIRPLTSEQQAARSRKARLREMAEGTWKNPGLSPEAKEINSRPHKHSGALASSIEKLSQGLGMAQLTPEEQEAQRAYRRQLRAARKDEVNAKRREWARKRKEAMTPEQRERLREKWRRDDGAVRPLREQKRAARRAERRRAERKKQL